MAPSERTASRGGGPLSTTSSLDVGASDEDGRRERSWPDADERTTFVFMIDSESVRGWSRSRRVVVSTCRLRLLLHVLTERRADGDKKNTRWIPGQTRQIGKSAAVGSTIECRPISAGEGGSEPSTYTASSAATFSSNHASSPRSRLRSKRKPKGRASKWARSGRDAVT